MARHLDAEQPFGLHRIDGFPREAGFGINGIRVFRRDFGDTGHPCDKTVLHDLDGEIHQATFRLSRMRSTVLAIAEMLAKDLRFRRLSGNSMSKASSRPSINCTEAKDVKPAA